MFKLEDKVGWSSQAQGRRKVKEGIVVQIVLPGALPDRERFLSLYRGSGVGGPRNHVTYVVQVGNKFYWPRVSALRFIGDRSKEDDAAWARVAENYSSIPDAAKSAFLAGRRSLDGVRRMGQ